jgi:hypothetical protein
MTYSANMKLVVQDARAWLAKHGGADRDRLQKTLDSSSMIGKGVLVIEGLVFFGVLLWGAYRPVAGGAGEWGFNPIAVAMALVTALIAPVATFITTPWRDVDTKKVRPAAVTATLGMVLVWAITAFELLGASGLVGTTMRVFDIEEDWRALLALGKVCTSPHHEAA